MVVVDTPGANNSPNTFGDLDAKPFRLNRLVTVPAQGTALVAVLPSDPFELPGCTPPTPNFECRGYVDISLPAIFRFVPGPSGAFGSFQQVAQSNWSVDVLLTPQNRATYLKPDGMIGAQTQSSLPLANGAGKMAIEPGQPFGLDGLTLDAPEISDLVADLPESQRRPALLAALMAQIDPSEIDRKAFNATQRCGRRVSAWRWKRGNLRHLRPNGPARQKTPDPVRQAPATLIGAFFGRDSKMYLRESTMGVKGVSQTPTHAPLAGQTSLTARLCSEGNVS